MNAVRYIWYLGTCLTAGLLFSFFQNREVPAEAGSGLVDAGRQVYISEGCIHCHSQYVRRVGADAALWGEATTVEGALSQQPVLIGNRRQGPDLANVALRRSPGWNRLHLIEPSAVVEGSRMPSFRHLFSGGNPRGEALLAYLASLMPESIITDKCSEGAL